MLQSIKAVSLQSEILTRQGEAGRHRKMTALMKAGSICDSFVEEKLPTSLRFEF